MDIGLGMRWGGLGRLVFWKHELVMSVVYRVSGFESGNMSSVIAMAFYLQCIWPGERKRRGARGSYATKDKGHWKNEKRGRQPRQRREQGIDQR